MLIKKEKSKVSYSREKGKGKDLSGSKVLQHTKWLVNQKHLRTP